MTITSILIPHRLAGPQLAEHLPELAKSLRAAVESCEIVLIDAGGAKPTTSLLAAAGEANVRLARLLPSGGLGAAIAAGVSAARGQQVLLMQPGAELYYEQIAELLSKLSRADLVFCRRQRNGISKAWHRVARIPRWLMLGLEVKDPASLLWAARREAVLGLDLPRGMVRYLPDLVAARGYRVTEALQTSPNIERVIDEGWPNPGDLLAAWWLSHRSRDSQWEEFNSPSRDILPINDETQRRKSA